jgi:hypothetical protein
MWKKLVQKAWYSEDVLDISLLIRGTGFQVVWRKIDIGTSVRIQFYRTLWLFIKRKETT